MCLLDGPVTGLVPGLVEFLSATTGDLSLHAAQAIYWITFHAPACVASFQAGAIPALVNLLNSSDGHLHPTSALRNIMSSVEDARVAALGTRAIPRFSLRRMASLCMLLQPSNPLLSINRHAQHYSRQEQSQLLLTCSTHPMLTFRIPQCQLWDESCRLWKTHELRHSKQESFHD
jgi:hypothetical protein